MDILSSPLNTYLNKDVRLQWTGKVQCFCGRQLSEFYRQNFVINVSGMRHKRHQVYLSRSCVRQI